MARNDIQNKTSKKDEGPNPKLYVRGGDEVKRKSPIRHKVKTHTRKGKRVNSFIRGSENPVIQTRKRIIKVKNQNQEPVFIMDDAPHLTKYHPEAQKLVWMSPERFSELVPPLLFVDEGSLSRVKEKIQKGEPQEPLWMEVNPYSDRTLYKHEGRHRALASEQTGIKKIPVIVYFRHDGDFVKPFPDFSVNKLKPFTEHRPYG